MDNSGCKTDDSSGTTNIGMLVKHIRQITSEKEKALNDALNSQNKCKDLCNQNFVRDQENGALQRKVLFLSGQLETVQSEFEYKKRSFKSLKECADMLQEENDSNKQKLIICGKKLEQTENELSAIKLHLDKANQKSEERSIALKALRQRLKMEERQSTNNQTKLDIEMKRSEELESTLKQFESRIAFLEQEMSRVDDERQSTQEKFKRAEAQICEMQNKRASSDASNQRLEQEKRNLESTLEEIIGKFKNVEKDLEEAQRLIKVKDLNIKELTSQLAKESLQRSLLQGNLEELVEESNKRN